MLIQKVRPLFAAILRSSFQEDFKYLSRSSIVYHKAAYEGDGKTTVRIINQDPDLGLIIDSYGTFGFRLNNGLTVLGPMAIFPRTVLSWQIHSSNNITADSLTLFRLLEPKVDLVIIGLETKDRKVLNSVFRASREAKLNVEILPTEHACATFNFLNAESRSIAGALIPPLHIEVNEDDMLNSKLHYGNLYNRRDDL
ncbi:NADH dehydrogenase [ubiquinone] 1 alpha subcomplex assembly factor 3 isoform X1 [Pieris napi]|uniref:NADH dehydrogenase [ubiquinone] 1 alpha subcomplex assembly factor 3 isoform X1 n=2 Tax=Pieris napi TaxID=78633 RepID=UPI001FBA052F|nr:NADH dehydrogenase [ubiquinone] 1 alpha subcomplex assembly factor 3 isoform X1 [Pieris napi]